MYLHRSYFNIGQSNDPNSYDEGVFCSDGDSWFTALQEELKSTLDNDVWDLVDLSDNLKLNQNEFYSQLVMGFCDKILW